VFTERPPRKPLELVGAVFLQAECPTSGVKALLH